MAIPQPLAEFICAEHHWQALPKKILLLGRQTMPFNEESLRQLGKKWGLEPIDVQSDNYTTSAINNTDDSFVTDECFFRMLGVNEIHALDHSDFEGADIIADICKPLPEELEGQFEFIFNGSTLDNVFDTAMAIKNIGRLLKPGGRVIHIETATTTRFSYNAISPSWFFDYYAVNGWSDCKIYMGAAGDFSRLISEPWAMLAFNPAYSRKPNAFTCDLGNQLGVQVILAQKGFESSSDKIPIQAHYRGEKDWAAIFSSAEKFLHSPRPLYLGSGGTGEAVEGFDGAWISAGWW